MEIYYKKALLLFEKYKREAKKIYKNNPYVFVATIALCILFIIGNLYIVFKAKTTTPLIQQDYKSNNWTRLSDKTHIKESLSTFNSKRLMMVFDQTDAATPGAFTLLPTIQTCSASIPKKVTLKFQWNPSEGAAWYFVVWSTTTNFDPHNFSPDDVINQTSRATGISGEWVQNATFLTKTDIASPAPGTKIYFSVIARVAKADETGTVATIDQNISIQDLYKCDGTDPATTGSSKYTLTADFDKASYKVGDTSKFCYKLTPQNIPFHVTITRTAPTNKSVLDSEDDGVGGGDCVTHTFDSTDTPKVTLHTKITVKADGTIVEKDASVDVAAASTTITQGNGTVTTTTTAPGQGGNETTPGTTITATPSATLPPCSTTTPATTTAGAGSNSPLDTEEWNVLKLINDHRQSLNLTQLKVSKTLTDASKWMVNDMATRNQLSHQDSLGRMPSQRCAFFGYPQQCAENAAMEFASAQSAYDGWLAACDDLGQGCTYGHKKNMEDPSWRAIGIGRKQGSNGQNWYWTTDFGTLIDAEVTPATAITPTETPACANPTSTGTPGSGSSGATKISVAIKLPGIGKVNGDNPNPTKATRSMTVIVALANSQNPTQLISQLNYSPANGDFEGDISLDNLAAGTYSITGKLNNTLTKVLSNALVVTDANKQYTIPQVYLASGDVNNDDALTVQDYTNFVGCYQGAASCDPVTKVKVDLNDDGAIDLDDLNILQRSFKENH